MTDEDIVAFKARASLVAEKLGITFPFDEEESTVETLEFSGREAGYRCIEADSKNLSTRAFFESLLIGRTGSTILVASIIPGAKEFYGPYWDDESGTGKHSAIDALRDFSRGIVTINKREN